MKKPHRRMHLVVWFVLAPVIAICGLALWLMQPAPALMDVPEALVTETSSLNR